MKYCWFVFFTLLLTVHTLKTCSPDCLSCDYITGNCSHCLKGFYLSTSSCLQVCPDNLYADNYSMTCKKIIESPVYIKAYTFSRCINSCGREFSDCSCKENCKLSGNCCSDFRFCEIVEDNHVEIKEKESKCKLTTTDKKICLQCKEKFYYYSNECHDKCPEGTMPNEENKICILSENCPSTHKNTCEKCDSKGTCLECTQRHFLHKGQCIKKCPKGFKANRENFSCQPEADYSFHWVFPSHHSCKNNCFKEFSESQSTRDCSCKSSCVRKGNCCDDYELHCEKYAHQEKLQSLHEQLLSSFEKTFNFTNLHRNLQNSYREKANTIKIDGNSTVNLFQSNKNMQIRHINKVNRNSNNLNKETIENKNSHNIISNTGDFNLNSDLGLNLNFDLENKLLHSLIHLKKNKSGLSLNAKNLLPPKIIKKKPLQAEEPKQISYHPEMSKNIKKEHIDIIRNIPKPEPVKTLPLIILPRNETQKIVNNNYEVHNNIYLNDNSLNLINSLHSKIFSMNNSNAESHQAGHQIFIGKNKTHKAFNLSNLNPENLIVINQGDVSENITYNKFEKIKEIQKLKEEADQHNVVMEEKKQDVPFPHEDKPVIPIMEEKNPQPIIQKHKGEPILQVKKSQPTVEQIKPPSQVDEKIAIQIFNNKTDSPILIKNITQPQNEQVEILSKPTAHSESKIGKVEEKNILQNSSPKSYATEPSAKSTPIATKPVIKNTTIPHEQKPQHEEIKKTEIKDNNPPSEEKKNGTEEKQPQNITQQEKTIQKDQENTYPAPEKVLIYQKLENKTLIVNKTQPLPEILEAPKIQEILKSFPEPENESNEPSFNNLFNQTSKLNPKEDQPAKPEIKNETSILFAKQINKTEKVRPVKVQDKQAVAPLVTVVKNEKINESHIEQPHAVQPLLKNNFTHINQTTKVKPVPLVTKSLDKNLTIQPEKQKKETLKEKEIHMNYTSPETHNTKVEHNHTNHTKSNDEIIVRYVNNTQSNQTVKNSNVSHVVNNVAIEEPKNYVKIKVVNMNKTEVAQKKIIKEHVKCNLDDLCVRCDKKMRCRKCSKNAFYNLIEGRCMCSRGYYHNKQLGQCKKCHPLCEVCSGGSSSECLTCSENAEFLTFHTCTCIRDFSLDPVLEMCLDRSDILAIKHTVPKTCKRGTYWEPRISECVEPANNKTKELKFATVLYLGGNQSPENLDENGEDIIKQKWNSANDITPGGMRQNFISGLYFREKFINFYNLTGEKFNPELVKVTAAGKKAAIKGSYSFLLGLMPTLESIVDKEFYNPKLYVGKNDFIRGNVNSNKTKESKKGANTIAVDPNQVVANTKLNRSLTSKKNLNSTSGNLTTSKNSKLKRKSNRLQQSNNRTNNTTNNTTNSTLNNTTKNSTKKKKVPKSSSLIVKNSTIKKTEENSNESIKHTKFLKTVKKNTEAPKKISKFKKLYTHEELLRIRKFDGFNPFKDNNDTEVLFEDIAPILPLVPSHTPIQSFSKDYGVSDLSICKGIQQLLTQNTETNRIKAEKIISKIRSKFNLHHYFHLPSQLVITPEVMKNLTLAFFANFNSNNKNITKMYIPKSIIAMIQEFNDLEIYGNIFGDSKNYVAKAILTPYSEQFLKNVDDEINHAYKSVIKSMKKYYKKGILDLKPLGDFRKLDFFFPDQQIFWGMMAFLSRLKGQQIPIPLTPAGVSFELSKAKKHDFNLTQYILSYNQYIYPENIAASKKIVNPAPALNRSVSDSSSVLSNEHKQQNQPNQQNQHSQPNQHDQHNHDSKDSKDEKNNKLKSPKNKTNKNSRYEYEELIDKRYRMQGDPSSKKNNTKNKDKNQHSDSESAIEKTNTEKSEDSSKDKKKKGKEKDSKDSKDKKNSKDSKENIHGKEFDPTANFLIRSNVDLMQDLARKFRNSNLYYIKVYYNHELIFDQSYLAFRDKLKEFIVDKDELRDFCFPPKTDIWLIICITLFACLVFQLLVIACLYTIKH